VQLDLPAGITRQCNKDVTITPDPVKDGSDANLGKDGNSNVVMVSYDSQNLGGTNGIKVTYPGTSGPLSVTPGGNYLVIHATKKTLNSDEGRGVALFDNFSQFNARRVAQELADKFDNETDDKNNKVQVVDIRPVALAIANNCLDGAAANLKMYANQNALNALVAYHKAKNAALKGMAINSFTDLLMDTLSRQQSLPKMKADQEAANLNELILANATGAPTAQSISDQAAKRSVFGRPSQVPDFSTDKLTKFMIDREIYGDGTVTLPKGDPTLKMALFRFFLEPSHEPVDNWTLSFEGTNLTHFRTYTFGDVFQTSDPNLVPNASYVAVIKKVLGDAMLGDPNKTDVKAGKDKGCAELAGDSLAWFTQAITNNPNYFNFVP